MLMLHQPLGGDRPISACPCPKPLTAECVLPLEDLRVLGELGGLMLLAEP